MARYVVGQVAELTGTFRNAAGALANPDTVTLAIRKPDGTFVSPVVAPSQVSTGVWHGFVTLNAAGVWNYAFTGTGTVDAIDDGAVIVRDLYSDLLMVADVTASVDTNADATVIQRMLDDALADINRFAGPIGSATQIGVGGFRLLGLHRPAASITSVVEKWSGTSSRTLAADDYRLVSNGYVLERLAGGTNTRYGWDERVEVTYVPADDLAIRESVQLDLVRLALTNQPGVTSQTIGSWTEQFGGQQDYQQRRNEILGRLSSGPSLVVI